MQQQITLQQFEAIDGALTRLHNRGELNHIAMTRGAIKNWMACEWMLFDYCVDAVGLESAQSFPSAGQCAATIVAGCLSGSIEIIDELEAV